MKKLIFFSILLALVTGCAQTGTTQPTGTVIPTTTPSPAPSPTVGMTPKVRAYLNEVTEIVQKNALNADQVDWENELEYIYQREQAAATTADVYDSVLYILLQLNDNHSRFFSPDDMDWFNNLSPESVENPPIAGMILQDHYAYLKVPPFASGKIEVNLQFGIELRDLVGALNAQSPCSWVIDLRENMGGNLPPMLVGLAPLIGDGQIGGFKFPNGNFEPITLEKGILIEAEEFTWDPADLQTVDIQPADPPIAILVGPHTASAGEMVALAFKGQPTVVYFGEDTAGLTTGNSRYDLSDGSMILLTSSVFVDRLGQVYPHGFKPDLPLESIYSTPDSIPAEVLQWLDSQESCAID